jgi:hypothetical protein
MKGISRKTETFIDDRPVQNRVLESPVEKQKQHKLFVLGMTENVPYRQSPRVHGSVKHELSDNFKNLNRVELEFLKCASTRHSFIASYFNHFGFDVKTIDGLEGMWKRREDIMEYEATKSDVKASKKKPKAK